MKRIAALTIGTLLSTSALAESNYFGGAYGGIQVGNSQLETRHSDLDYWYNDSHNVSFTEQSAVGGLRLGYDWVKGSALYGVMAEASFGNQSSINEMGSAANNLMYKIGSQVKGFGSVRAKAGVVAEKIALFATAGVAFADIKHKYQETDGSNETFDQKGEQTGYVFGVGAAYAFDEKSSIGFDVSRYQFGARSHEMLDSNGSGNGYFFKLDDNLTTVSVSYNVRF